MAGSRARRDGGGGRQPDHSAGKETEEQRRTAKTISSFPGPWTLPGCLEATAGPEPTDKPVSSAGCTTGGLERGARRSDGGNETSHCCLTEAGWHKVVAGLLGSWCHPWGTWPAHQCVPGVCCM